MAEKYKCRVVDRDPPGESQVEEEVLEKIQVELR